MPKENKKDSEKQDFLYRIVGFQEVEDNVITFCELIQSFIYVLDSDISDEDLEKELTELYKANRTKYIQSAGKILRDTAIDTWQKEVETALEKDKQAIAKKIQDLKVLKFTLISDASEYIKESNLFRATLQLKPSITPLIVQGLHYTGILYTEEPSEDNQHES